jgi:hypothetical protein
MAEKLFCKYGSDERGRHLNAHTCEGDGNFCLVETLCPFLTIPCKSVALF